MQASICLGGSQHTTAYQLPVIYQEDCAHRTMTRKYSYKRTKRCIIYTVWFSYMCALKVEMEDCSHMCILSNKPLKFLYLYTPLPCINLHGFGVKVCRIEWKFISRDHHGNASSYSNCSPLSTLHIVLTKQFWKVLGCSPRKFRLHTGILTILIYCKLF